MSNAYQEPYSGFVANLQGTYYGLVHLALATTAYVYEGVPTQLSAQFKQFVENTLPQIQDPGFGGATGTWNLEWGPAFCTPSGELFNDNLVAVVSYTVSGATGPTFYAVLCRGTDTLGGIAQISEDMNAFIQQPLVNVLSTSGSTPYTYGNSASGMPIYNAATPSYPNPKSGNFTPQGHVASGSADALIAVSNLVPYDLANDTCGNYLADQLITLLNANNCSGVPVIVAGHSLGGALTQMVATYLYGQLSSTGLAPIIIPQAFAPPTVGDQTFVTFYNQLFQYSEPGGSQGAGSQFWVNTADLVPCAWTRIGMHLNKDNPPTTNDLWGNFTWEGTNSVAGPFLGSQTEQETLAAFVNTMMLYYEGKSMNYGSVQPANVQNLTYNPNNQAVPPYPNLLPAQSYLESFVAAMGQNWNASDNNAVWTALLEYQHFPGPFPGQYNTLMLTAFPNILQYPSTQSLAITLPKPPPLNPNN